MALPLYAFTLFISAFILFLVQPIIGKIILPKLGGTPQVWNTCMMFFQMVLLAGYAYTHNASTRLTLRQQLLAHSILVLLPLIVLLPFPFAFMGLESGYSIWGFVPDLGSNPIPSTLKILFLYVALPFMVVATTAPLLQRWFVYTGHPAAKDPYFLYGASNLGSMLSLIVYPILIEPYATLQQQGWIYVIGYVALIVFVMACASMVWGAREPVAKLKSLEPKPEPEPALAPPLEPSSAPQTGITATTPAQGPGAPTSIKTGPPGKQFPKGGGSRPGMVTEPSVSLAPDSITFGRRFRWVMLAMIPSSLMLGIISHITTDLSPNPVFWLVPLILYLLSFILVFARWPVVWVEQPHTVLVYAQPFFIAAMIMVDVLHWTSDTRFIVLAILAHVLGFFSTALVCHGELAKDRPSTKHLTEFYLWMSVGGMLGGLFNGLIAPIIFWKLWEFPLAIFAAALARPKMFDTGLGDNFLAGIFEGGTSDRPAAATKATSKGHKSVHLQHHSVTASDSLVNTLDWAWPVGIFVIAAGMIFTLGASSLTWVVLSFTVPLALCLMQLARPLRIGLGVGAVLLMQQISLAQQDSRVVHSSRSYFGTISVKNGALAANVDNKEVILSYNNLVHGHIDHGLNFIVPDKLTERGNVDRDWSRLATTYYHREGPVGRVMEKFNWFPGPSNTYQADARMPVSLVGNAVADLGIGSLPLTNLVSLWSEPPYATVGLGTGTMASYGRPYQHVHFYEIDNQILRLSLVEHTRKITDFNEYEKFRSASNKPTYFNYLERALERGCSVQVLMGDARLRMAQTYTNHYMDPTDKGGGPNNFYHMMVVDAFSSDAIPAHLLTKQAFQMYFEKLTEDGILCVHTSNRFVDLPLVVAAVADDLNYRHLRGHDNNDDKSKGHYTSEWVMVAKKQEYLRHLSGDTEFLDRYRSALKAKKKSEDYWDRTEISQRYLWTDDYYNLMSVVRFR